MSSQFAETQLNNVLSQSEMIIDRYEEELKDKNLKILELQESIRVLSENFEIVKENNKAFEKMLNIMKSAIDDTLKINQEDINAIINPESAVVELDSQATQGDVIISKKVKGKQVKPEPVVIELDSQAHNPTVVVAKALKVKRSRKEFDADDIAPIDCKMDDVDNQASETESDDE